MNFKALNGGKLSWESFSRREKPEKVFTWNFRQMKICRKEESLESDEEKSHTSHLRGF